MKKILLCSSSIFLLIFLSVNAQAYIVVWDQLPHATPGGLGSGVKSLLYPTGVHVYDDFTLGSNYSITGINWWGLYSPSYSGASTFTLSFYDANNVPSGSPTQVSNVSVTGSNRGDGVYEYSAALTTPFPALANTKYWLSIYNTVPDSRTWGWQRANDDGNGSIQSPIEFPGTPYNVAFQLTISDPPVPIPSAVWLLGSGLIAMVVIRRRARK